MRHLNHYLQPRTERLETASWSGYENQLAFLNPDNSVVIVSQNDLPEPRTVDILVGDDVLMPTLPQIRSQRSS
jgi:glucosylceramidase